MAAAATAASAGGMDSSVAGHEDRQAQQTRSDADSDRRTERHDQRMGAGSGEPDGMGLATPPGARAKEDAAAQAENHRRFVEQVWTTP